MNSIIIVQVMAILYFMFAVRYKVWQTSLNTFVVFTGFFVITATHEIVQAKEHWINYHLTLVGFIMTFLMARVVYQRITKKNDEKCLFPDCKNKGRRKDDK